MEFYYIRLISRNNIFTGKKIAIYLYLIRKFWYISYITNHPYPGDQFDPKTADIIRYNEYMTRDA